jgi:hypothetical protein
LPNGSGDPAAVQQVLQFLRALQARIEEYFAKVGRRLNYEDLYYACSQLVGHESGNLENPLVAPFARDILGEIPQMFTNHEAAELGLYHLTEESAHYIADVVLVELSQAVRDTSSVNFILDACADPQLPLLSVFTLNHDKILETVLQSNHIEFLDGFGKPVHNVRYWSPSLLESEDTKVSLFKLHGSLDWYRFRPRATSGHWYEDEVGIPLNNDPYDATTRDGQGHHLCLDGRPLLLIGTFNKMLEYTGGPFFDLFAAFRRRLRGCRRLFVCGYGFGDKGVNSQIIEWFYEARGKRICVAHPDPDSLVATTARGAIRNKWKEWLQERALRVIAKPAQSVTYGDLQAAFVEAAS